MSCRLFRLPLALLATAMSPVAPRAAEPGLVVTEADSFAMEQVIEASLRDSYPRILTSLGSTLAVDSGPYEEALRRSVKAIMSVRPDGCDANRLETDLCGMRPVNIPSTSMAPALDIGDDVMTLAPTDARPLRRGDAIVFRTEGTGSRGGVLHIDRIVGMPGETVQLRTGVVEVDGQPMVHEATGQEITTVDHVTLPIAWEVTKEKRRYRVVGSFGKAPVPVMDDTEPIRVPDGSYYVLGDNRENALDCRFPEQLGSRFIAASQVVGRVMVIFASRDPARIGLNAE